MSSISCRKRFSAPEWELPRMTAIPERSSKRRRARLQRREKLQLVADEAVERWQELRREEDEEIETVFRPLPRPPTLGVEPSRESSLPPPRVEEVYEAGIVSSLRRLMVWLYAAASFGMAVLMDKLRRIDSVERRARRMRQT